MELLRSRAVHNGVCDRSGVGVLDGLSQEGLSLYLQLLLSCPMCCKKFLPFPFCVIDIASQLINRNVAVSGVF